MRNKQFDIILAIGIIFVLMGHSHQPAFLFYPAYTFHMALFFFVSGYFFKPMNQIKPKIRYILKKISKQFIPYFLLLLLFGFLTQILRSFGINLGAEMNVNSLFWDVFARGDQFNLYLSGWFLLTLFFANVTAGILFTKNNYFNTAIFIVSACLLYYALEQGKNNIGDWHLEIIRSIFGLFFIELGYFFKVYEETIKKYLLTPSAIIGLFLLVNVLNIHFGNLGYSILLGNIGNELVWVPLLSTMAIILMVYIASHFLAQITANNSPLLLIGQNTFAIMVWHLFSFLLLNLILFALDWIPFESLSDVYFRFEIEKTWPIYLAFGLFMPIIITQAYFRSYTAIVGFTKWANDELNSTVNSDD